MAELGGMGAVMREGKRRERENKNRETAKEARSDDDSAR